MYRIKKKKKNFLFWNKKEQLPLTGKLVFYTYMGVLGHYSELKKAKGRVFIAAFKRFQNKSTKYVF